MSASLPKGKSRSFLTRWLRRLGWSIVCLITLVFLIHTVENWRGSRAWAHTLDDLAASGAELDLVKELPVPFPDSENIAMHPAFRGFMFTQPGGVRPVIRWIPPMPPWWLSGMHSDS